MCVLNTFFYILKKNVLDHYWQTESGCAICAPCMGFEKKPTIVEGSSNLPVPGYDIRILKKEKN